MESGIAVGVGSILDLENGRWVQAAVVMVAETVMRTLNAMHNGQLLAWGSVC